MSQVLPRSQFAALVEGPGPTAIASAGGLDLIISNSAILAVSSPGSGTSAERGGGSDPSSNSNEFLLQLMPFRYPSTARRIPTIVQL